MCGQNIDYARFIGGQQRMLFACGLTDELIPGIPDSRYCLACQKQLRLHWPAFDVLFLDQRKKKK